jgi:hypothetical protein
MEAGVAEAADVDDVLTTVYRWGELGQGIRLRRAPDLTYVVNIVLDDTAAGVHTLASTSALRAYQGEPFVALFTAPLTGTLTIADASAPRCHDESKGFDICAIDMRVTAAVVATANQQYELAIDAVIEQELTEVCAKCPGVEGCDH